jgi:hypothetical protein
MGHDALRNLNNNQLDFHGLMIDLLGTLTSRAHILRSKTPNCAQYDPLER